MVDQHGLLKQLAQGGNYFVGEEKTTANPPTYDVPTHLMTSSGDAQEAFASIHFDREATSLTDEGAFYSCNVSERAVIKVFNKIPLADVIWDEDVEFVDSVGAAHEMFNDMSTENVVWDVALLHNLNSQDTLVQHEAQFDKYLVVDNDITVDLVIKDLPTLDSDTFLTESDMGSANKLSSNLPLGVVWDEEMSSKMGKPSDLLQQLACGSKGTDYIATHANQIKFKVPIASIVAAHIVFNGMCPQVTWDAKKHLGINTHKGLLKQLALGKSYMDEEKTTHIVELNTSEVLTHVGD